MKNGPVTEHISASEICKCYFSNIVILQFTPKEYKKIDSVTRVIKGRRKFGFFKGNDCKKFYMEPYFLWLGVHVP